MEYGGNSGQNWEGQQLENFSNYNDDWYNNTSGGQQTGQSVVGNNLWPQGGGDLNSWGQGIGSTSSQGVAIPPPLPLNEHLPRNGAIFCLKYLWLIRILDCNLFFKNQKQS